MTELIDIPQCSALLGLSERWVYEMLRNKKLPGAAKIGGKWRVDRDTLIAWIAKGGELAKDARPTPDGAPGSFPGSRPK